MGSVGRVGRGVERLHVRVRPGARGYCDAGLRDSRKVELSVDLSVGFLLR
jgi:hypothetical protein